MKILWLTQHRLRPKSCLRAPACLSQNTEISTVGLVRPPSWVALFTALWLAGAAWSVRAAGAKASGTEGTYGPPEAPYALTIYGDFGCPEGTPNLADWWKVLQEPALAPLTRIVYRHAPKKASKNTKLAAHAVLAAGEQGDSYFFQMAARVCDIVRKNPKKKLERAFMAKEAAKLGIDEKKFISAYKKNKKQRQKRVMEDAVAGAKHFGASNAPDYLVNGKPTVFANASAFRTWVITQEQEKVTAAAEAEPAAGDSAPVPVLRVAVYDMIATDIPENIAFVVRDALTAELRKLNRVSVISMDEVRTMLSYEADKKLAGCDSDSCLTEIAEALGVDVVVSGALSAVGDKRYMTLKRIEQQKGLVSRQFNKTLEPDGGGEFLAVLGDAVQELFPDRAPRDGLERGVAQALVARLHPPPFPPVVFWTGVALTGTALAISGMAGAATLAQYSDFLALRDSKEGTPVDGSRLGALRDSTDQWQTYSWAAILTTGALASLTGASAALTNWDEESMDAARNLP